MDKANQELLNRLYKLMGLIDPDNCAKDPLSFLQTQLSSFGDTGINILATSQPRKCKSKSNSKKRKYHRRHFH